MKNAGVITHVDQRDQFRAREVRIPFDESGFQHDAGFYFGYMTIRCVQREKRSIRGSPAIAAQFLGNASTCAYPLYHRVGNKRVSRERGFVATEIPQARVLPAKTA